MFRMCNYIDTFCHQYSSIIKPATHRKYSRELFSIKNTDIIIKATAFNLILEVKLQPATSHEYLPEQQPINAQ